MPYAELSDGKKIYYLDEGPRDGRPVLLVHGWCATSGLWSRQVPVLAAEGYRVVALDSAGHGRSGKHVAEVTMGGIIQALLEFVDCVGFGGGKFAMIGHSAGGGATMALYFTRPRRIACMGLLNTGYDMRDSMFRKLFWTFVPPYMEILFSPPVKVVTRPLVNVFAHAFAAAYHDDPAQARRWFQDVHRTRGRVARLELEELMRHNIRDRLKTIEVPALVIGGDHDFLAPGRMSVVLGEEIPHAETHILPINHVGKMFRADLVNPLLVDFLRRHYPAG